MAATFLLPANLEKVCSEEQRKYVEPAWEKAARSARNLEQFKKSKVAYAVLSPNFMGADFHGRLYTHLEAAMDEAKPWDRIYEFNLEPPCSKVTISATYFGNGAKIFNDKSMVRSF